MTTKPLRKFVKYGNRKLHELGSTDAYVPMDGLGDIVAEGYEIEITDDVTGEDLTLATLARILYDRCREDSKFAEVKEIRRLIVAAAKREENA